MQLADLLTASPHRRAAPCHLRSLHCAACSRLGWGSSAAREQLRKTLWAFEPYFFQPSKLGCGSRKKQLPAGFKIWEQKIQPDERALPLSGLPVPFKAGTRPGPPKWIWELAWAPRFSPWIALVDFSPALLFPSSFSCFHLRRDAPVPAHSLVPGEVPWIHHPKLLPRC